MPRPDGLVASVLFTSSQEMTQLPPRMRVQGWKLMDARLESTSLSPSALTRLLLGFIWDDPPTAETAIEVVAAEATEMMTTMTVGTVVVVDVITTADPPPPTTVRGGTIAPVPDHTHPVRKDEERSRIKPENEKPYWISQGKKLFYRRNHSLLDRSSLQAFVKRSWNKGEREK
uniref:Uncharacterized protein n=1 Tax=Cacopsylla melanoneura TaxID=428564 RepID=A0A8D8UWI0_9HEMI